MRSNQTLQKATNQKRKVVCLLSLCSILLIANVFFSIYYALGGKNSASGLEERIAKVSKETQVLTESGLTGSSLIEFQEKAESLGMVKASDIVYLEAQDNMALRP